MIKRPRCLPDPRKGRVHWREQFRMSRNRLSEAFTTKNSGPDLTYDRPQTPNISIVSKQIESVVDPNASLQKEREVPCENRHIIGAGAARERDRNAPNRARSFFGHRVNWNEAEIFDAP